MRRSVLVFVLLFPLLPAALAEPVPELEIESWLAAPEGETLGDLEGRVVLLLLGGAGDPAAPEPWNDLRAAYWEKGLRIVALLEKAPEGGLAGVEYSIAVGKAEGEGARAVLVGADGDVAWTGDPKELDDETLVKLLRKAKSGSKVTARIDENVAYWTRQAERAEGHGNYDEALTCLARIEKHRPDTEEALAAAAKIKELKADKAIKKEVSAAGKYVRFREELSRTRGSDKKIAALVKKLERFVAKEAGTLSATRADRLLQRLRVDPAVQALKDFIAKERISTADSGWRTKLPKPPQVEFAKSKKYFWILQTSEGAMKLKFFPDVAPMHVSSTIYLTELGFYDGLGFHRVIPSFMAQGGCPTGDGHGSPGYAYAGEFSPRARTRPGRDPLAWRTPVRAPTASSSSSPSERRPSWTTSTPFSACWSRARTPWRS